MRARNQPNGRADSPVEASKFYRSSDA